MAVLVVLICIFNIIMWIVFLHNFKKLFTTDDVIESAKASVNRILTDFDQQAERNLEVLDDAISRLKALNADAEKKIRIMNEMERAAVGLNELKGKISESSAARGASAPVKKAAEAYARTKNRPRSSVKEDDSVVLTLSGASVIGEEKTLFDEEPVNQKLDITVLEDGASYKKIPVITPDVVSPEIPEKNIQDNVVNSVNENPQAGSRILQLFDAGKSLDEIAALSGCSTTEVQFALTMSGRI